MVKVKFCKVLNRLIAFRGLVTSNEGVVKGQSGIVLFSLIDFDSLCQFDSVHLLCGVLHLLITSPTKV